MSIKTRLNRHFVAFSAVAAAGAMAGFAENADAAIVHSGIVNINVPSTFAGVYLNVVTGATDTVGSFPGYDVNPWGSSAQGYFSAFAGGAYVLRTGGGATGNLPFGTAIGVASLFGNLDGSTTGAQPHIVSSSDNLIGFRFTNEANANATHYGWMRMSYGTTLSGQPRTLVEYAYEDVAGADIAAGAIPAPGALALLGLGGLAAARRRRA